MSDDRWRREQGDVGDLGEGAPTTSANGPTDVPYELPEIVPATAEAPAEPSGPQLPPRQRVAPAVAAGSPAGPAAPPSAMPPIQRTPAAPTMVGAVARPAAPAPAPAPVAPSSWSDHMPAVVTGPTPPAAQAGRSGVALRAPGRRPRVRRVTRVVRHVDPWSVFKVALVFNVVGYLVVLTSGVLLWRVADSTGTVDNIERWFTQFGWETFELKGGEIFSNAWIIGLFVAVGLTGAAVLMATLFNLVSDIVGGVRVTVLEEEVVERTAASTRRYVVRRPPVADAAIAGSVQWSVDDDGPAAAPETHTVPAGPAAHDPRTVAAAVRTPATDWTVDDDLPL